jgi:hypothetical protein
MSPFCDWSPTFRDRPRMSLVVDQIEFLGCDNDWARRQLPNARA